MINPPVDNSLIQLIQNMGQTDDLFQRGQAEAGMPGLEITTKRTAEGTTHSVEMGDQDLKTVLQTMNAYGQVVDAYQKEIARLSSQQQHINPILNVLATIGGATAMQDKRLPPIVRALGESSRLLNPTYQELENRKLAVLGEEQGALRGMGALAEAQERTREFAAARQAAAEDRALRTKEMQIRTDLMMQGGEDRLKRERAAREDARLKTALTHFDTELRATKGREVPYDKFAAGMNARGVYDEERVKAAYEDYHAAAQTYRDAEKDRQAALQATPAYQNRIEQEQATTDVAQNIVDKVHKGDPSGIDSIRQVAGAFGAQKQKVMQKIIKLDPTISEARLERIVKIEDDFSLPGGKGNQQIVSYGQFSQHVGDLADAYKSLPVLPAKYANKTLNWLRQNAMDNPQVARVVAALEPVQNEFETFLKNNRALYESDRKSGAQMLNQDMPIQARLAALNQMGKTIEARYNQIATNYKKLTGFDLSKAHPLPPESIEGLRKVGVEMPQTEDEYDYIDGKLVKR